MENIIKELSSMLDKATDSSRYCLTIYETLSKIKYSKLLNIYKIRFGMRYLRFRSGEEDMGFWEFKLLNSTKLPEKFKEGYFKAQYFFLNKFKFDAAMFYSIERYLQRKEEEQFKESIKESDSAISEGLGSGESQKKRSLRKKRILPIPDIKNNRKTFTRDKEDDEEIDEEKKQKAMEIIKKLFVRKFQPGGDEKTFSKNKLRWIEIINKHMDRKNAVIDTFVDQHVEKLSPDFNKNTFYGLDLQVTKVRKLKMLSISGGDRNRDKAPVIRNDNSSYQSNSSRTSQDYVLNIKDQIKGANVKMKKSLRITFYLTLLFFLLWSVDALFMKGMMMFTHIVMFDNDFIGDAIKTQELYTGLFNSQVHYNNRFIELNRIEWLKELEKERKKKKEEEEKRRKEEEEKRREEELQETLVAEDGVDNGQETTDNPVDVIATNAVTSSSEEKAKKKKKKKRKIKFYNKEDDEILNKFNKVNMERLRAFRGKLIAKETSNLTYFKRLFTGTKDFEINSNKRKLSLISFNNILELKIDEGTINLASKNTKSLLETNKFNLIGLLLKIQADINKLIISNDSEINTLTKRMIIITLTNKLRLRSRPYSPFSL